MRILNRRALQADGYSDTQIRTHVRSGSWTRLRRDGYLLGAADDGPEQAHRNRIVASLQLVGVASTVSHASAGVLWGLPVPRRLLTHVHVIRAQRDGAHAREQLHVHAQPLPDAHRAELDGLPTTSLARTAVDLACLCHEWEALAVLDAAVRMLTDVQPLRAVVAASARRHGIGRARWALTHADGRAGSPVESISRYWMIQGGLPMPELQYEIRDSLGRLLGIADFAWPELGVVGEVDGRVKYDELLRPGQSSADVVLREKARENSFRRNGWWVYRWLPSDLHNGYQFVRRLADFLYGQRP